MGGGAGSPPLNLPGHHVILHDKNKFFKNAQNQRAKLIFSKNAKILLFNFGLFQQVSLT